jgi:hypothetical protein
MGVLDVGHLAGSVINGSTSRYRKVCEIHTDSVSSRGGDAGAIFLHVPGLSAAEHELWIPRHGSSGSMVPICRPALIRDLPRFRGEESGACPVPDRRGAALC